jgi:hypothetical protein
MKQPAQLRRLWPLLLLICLLAIGLTAQIPMTKARVYASNISPLPTTTPTAQSHAVYMPALMKAGPTGHTTGHLYVPLLAH